MNINMIAMDLDGTLLAPDHLTVTERTLQALTAAHEKGVRLAISTGRTLSLIQAVYEKIPFVDYIIYSNGACVYDCKAQKNIFEALIDAETTDRILSIYEANAALTNVYQGGKVYMPKTDLTEPGSVPIPRDFFEYYLKQVIVCGDLRREMQGKEAELCVAFFADDEKRKEAISQIEHLPNLSCVSAIAHDVEIMSATAGKGNALAAICDAIGCTAENAMAFGDAANDCSMLEFAAYSFAMANADEICKLSAKYRAKSNADDGVADAIETYVLNM